ncbi:MAG: hypothetical protein ACLR71_11805 [[Clostridium] scindens]
MTPKRNGNAGRRSLLTKGHVSCFDGLQGKGTPICTIIRGKVVAADGAYKEDAIGYGKYVTPVKAD